jgi:hypothetical protein
MDFPQLTDQQWRLIDELLFDENPLMAVKRIREITGMSLHDSGALMHDRYKKLRQSFPEKFRKTDEEYWAGWYS